MGKQTVAVIGIGEFGRSLIEELVRLGMDVIALDNDENAVKKVSEIVPASFVIDYTDEEALKEVKIKDADIAIIAFGGHVENAILTTVLLKELGVKRVVVRIDDEHYIQTLKKIGADDIIQPSRSAGTALANRLGKEDFVDFYKLSDKYSLVQLEVNDQYEPKTLTELRSKELYGINIVLIERNNDSLVPGGKDEIRPLDKIYVVGTQKEIRVFREAINGKKRK